MNTSYNLSTSGSLMQRSQLRMSVGALALVGVALASCGAGPSDLSAKGGIWSQTVAGIKIGQDCRSAHRTFSSSKWHYSSSYTSPPPDRTQADGSYSDQAETVEIMCRDTPTGMRVSGIDYSASSQLLNEHDFVQLADSKFGQPAVQTPYPQGGTVYGWGEGFRPGGYGGLPNSDEPNAMLIIYDHSGGRLFVRTGLNWLKEQRAELASKAGEALRAKVRPAL